LPSFALLFQGGRSLHQKRERDMQVHERLSTIAILAILICILFIEKRNMGGGIKNLKSMQGNSDFGLSHA
jgi:hypothetical protein